MKTVEKLSAGLNYSAVELGTMTTLEQYKFAFAPGVEIPGKVFVGAELSTTGSELSFQAFAPNTENGFLHTHKSHEELYIFVSGNGEFQVDGNVFPISEGIFSSFKFARSALPIPVNVEKTNKSRVWYKLYVGSSTLKISENCSDVKYLCLLGAVSIL